MRCFPGDQPRIEKPKMSFLCSPCSLPQSLARFGLELLCKLLIRLALSGVGWVGTRLLDFSPCSQGGSGWDGTSARRPSRRLDQHIDAAGGEGELAPGLVVDGNAVFDALGAGEA